MSPPWYRYFAGEEREMVDNETGAGTGLVAGADGNLSIATNGVTNTMLRDSIPLSVIGRPLNSTGDPQDIQATANDRVLGRFGDQLVFKDVSAIPATVADGDYGDITVSSSGAAWAIDADAVTNAKLANMAQATIKGRASGAGTGDPTDLTAAQVKTILALASTDISDFNEAAQDTVGGILTDSATIDFTYDDAAPSITAIVKDDSITYAKIQNVSATDKVLGRSTAGAGDVEEIACTSAGRSMIAAADAQAQRVLLRNAVMVRKAANQTAADYTAGVAITWDSEIYDDGGWHDNSTNPSRLTVPSGITRVRAGGMVLIANNTSGVAVTLGILKNGSLTFDGACSSKIAASGTSNRHFVASGPISVTAGDYLELYLLNATDASIDITATESNFWAEAC